MAANLVKWVVTTQAAFEALATKDAYTLYWLEDTHEIYKGAVPYTEGVILYDTALPAKGAAGKVYIENTTLQGSVWVGGAWKTVIAPVSQTVMEGEAATTKAVSGAAVKAYVEAQAATIAAQAVTAMSYDEVNKAIKYTKNGTETSVPLTLLADQVAYDGATGKLTLKDHAGTTLSEVNLPLDNFVKSGTYDEATNALVLTLQQGGTVTIPAADLVKIYHAGDTATAKVVLETEPVTGDTLIKVNVQVSATANNAIVANADGLFVDKEALLKVAELTNADEILIVDGTTGHAKASGVKLADLATKAYVDGIVTTITADYVARVDVVKTLAEINTAAPSETKVISERVLVEALSWQTV